MTARLLTLIQPDDWHVHFRDGEMLKAVAPLTARQFGRAIIMPNLKPPVITTSDAASYRDRITAALPRGSTFQPLMALYLTDRTDPADVKAGFKGGVVTAVKYYPAGATTNSDSGVSDVAKVRSVLEMMQRIGMPLLIHGEVTDPSVDIFDREKVFIERVMMPIRRDFPALKIVFEHITTKDAADYVLSESARAPTGATVTAHHLMINRNALFVGGLRPHAYCLPVAKREEHRLALVAAATSGAACFFPGTDSAPHLRSAKERDCGCAGIFTAPCAVELYAQVFDRANALDRLEKFMSLNGPAFYGLAVNKTHITLHENEVHSDQSLPSVPVGQNGEAVLSFVPPLPLNWRVAPVS